MLKTFLFSVVMFLSISCHTNKSIINKQGGEGLQGYVIQKNVVAKNGSVVSAHALASKAGIGILKKGGNAIDAAICTQLALAVVYPAAGNIGGGGFMVIHLADGQQLSLDFREMAPWLARVDMFVDSVGNVIDGKSVNGHLAAGVPGVVAGLFAAAKYGKLPFRDLIQPAIDLAENGFVLSDAQAISFNELQADLKKYNTVLPVFALKVWKAGDTLVQTDLAATLKRIRDDGMKGFYEGTTARLIVEEMKRGGGIITEMDLKKYVAKFRKPRVFDYKGYQIVGMPMPSSGGVLVNQMMKMIEDRNIAAMGFETPASVQLMTEVERRAYADRAEYMADGDFYSVPEDDLVSKDYLHKRMKDFKPLVAGNSKITKAGVVAIRESNQTTHFSVVDKERNAVAVTTTLNNSYGCKTVVGGAGFFLNDEMDDFSAKPGVPNLYGALGGKANAIQPGKRMLSSMAPTIVLKNSKPFLVLGTPGGTTIPTSVFQTLVDVLEFQMSAQDAIDKPKFHHQWLPDTLVVENGFEKTVIESLQKMGYTIQLVPGIGRTEVIKILDNGQIEGVADKRGEDDAEGY